MMKEMREERVAAGDSVVVFAQAVPGHLVGFLYGVDASSPDGVGWTLTVDGEVVQEEAGGIYGRYDPPYVVEREVAVRAENRSGVDVEVSAGCRVALYYRRPSDALREKQGPLRRKPEGRSRTVHRKNFTVRGPTSVVQSSLPGRLNEFVVRSPTTEFSLLLRQDGVDTLYDSFDGLEALSENSDTLDAYEELDEEGNPTGFSIVRVRGVDWKASLDLAVVAPEMVADYVYASWTEGAA